MLTPTASTPVALSSPNSSFSLHLAASRLTDILTRTLPACDRPTHTEPHVDADEFSNLKLLIFKQTPLFFFSLPLSETNSRTHTPGIRKSARCVCMRGSVGKNPPESVNLRGAYRAPAATPSAALLPRDPGETHRPQKEGASRSKREHV